jgi:hypothetical protein
MSKIASLREPYRQIKKNMTPKTQYAGDIQWQVMTYMKVNDHITLGTDNQSILV